MANFHTEIRETYGKQYVKVFLKENSRITEGAHFLNSLQCVKTANITNNKETDLTVYPAKVYSAEEVKAEIDSKLDYLWTAHPIDPVIKNDAFDTLSDKSYGQILDLIILSEKI